MNTQVDNFVRQMEFQLSACESLEQAREQVKDLFRNNGAMTAQIESDIDAAYLILRKRREDFEILRPNSILRERPKWYAGPKAGDIHWPALKKYLLETKKWSADNVGSINRASDEILSLMDNPLGLEVDCRGLVVGYVQSGKTANMTAVIAKAIDAGYDSIILLAGLTNKLRQQTQRRIEKDIVQRHPFNWQKLTTSDENGDFQVPPDKAFLVQRDMAKLAVVKKNVSPLEKLIKTVRGTSPGALRQLKFLVIDDECDQASVNSASKETDMTRINELIRELLHVLPKRTYVGYTATPFANVLINPYGQHGVQRDGVTDDLELDDLYPRDFITALEKSPDYFGAEALFGRPASQIDGESESDDGLDMIRDVSPEDEAKLQPPSRNEREDFYPEMPDTLCDAILYYLACCAVRRARGDFEEHMTMLIHTSAYVVLHQRLESLVTGWIERQQPEILSAGSEINRRLFRVWDNERNRLPDDITDARSINPEEIQTFLPEVLDALSVVVENGASDDRIDYEGKPKTYIVVGGSILARGLTLEGLMVSYFIRSASQYDTLLQMGRWFGYRQGYEDLPRIWMPSSLQQNFRALAGIEAEIRADIRQYVEQDPLSPMEYAVRIRSLPGMAITAANKMRHARDSEVSLWGRHLQTIRFEHTNSDVVAANWKAAADFVSIAAQVGTRDGNRKLFRDVPKGRIMQFLTDYTVHDSHKELSNRMLLSFVRDGGDPLDFWNVGVMEIPGGNLSDKSLGRLGHLNMFNRSRLESTSPAADIKALMSRKDVLFDCPDVTFDSQKSWEELKAQRLTIVSGRPLLLIYPIDANSEPAWIKTGERGKSRRVPLEAVGDLIGVGIILPGSKELSGTFVSVSLDPPDAEEIAAMEAEEAEAFEAAGDV